jgi:hypothetical protein
MTHDPDQIWITVVTNVSFAHGERFLLRPLEVEGGNWRLAALSPGEVPLPLYPGDLETSGLFWVGVAVVHHLGPRGGVKVGDSRTEDLGFCGNCSPSRAPFEMEKHTTLGIGIT